MRQHPALKPDRLRPTPHLIRLAGLAAALFTALICVGATVSFSRQREQAERSQVLLEASTVRASLESGLNTRLHMARGLVAYIESNPSMSQEEFAAYASALITDDPTIRNLSVLTGTVISFVYPYTQNMTALGHDLAEVPDQRESVFRAMETREPILSGPLPLVQGGNGLIIRMSVYPQDATGQRYYWGQASVVIVAEAIESFAQFGRFPHLLFAIRHLLPGDQPGEVFHGGAELYAANPVLLSVEVPGGIWQLAAMPIKGWRHDQRLVWFLTVISLVMGFLVGVVVFILLNTRATLRVMAYHDQLTKLPNRSLFWATLKTVSALAKREDSRLCLCMLDLDDFKQVNDNLGHPCGDLLLSEVAARLQAQLRSSDIIARMGGDEFAVLARVHTVEGQDALIAKIRACFDEPFRLGDTQLLVSCSIGMAAYPEQSSRVEGALNLADQAMYRDKQRHHGHRKD